MSSGGGSTSSKWKPNEYQKQILPSMVDLYNNQYIPTANNLANISNSQRKGLASQTIDYNTLLDGAMQQAISGQNGIAGLTTGQLPQAFMDNVQQQLTRASDNLIGNSFKKAADAGMINSSVLTASLNDNSANINDLLAKKQSDYMSQLSELYNGQIANAGSLINLAGGAQENAQNAASNTLTDSLNAYNAASGILGTGGSQTTTQKTGGSGLVNGLLGIGSALLMCFAGDTKISTQDGDKDIKDIKVGDKVLCVDNKGKFAYKDVVEVQKPSEQEVYEVIAEKGKVKTTLSQPLMVNDGSFVDVGLMKLNTELKIMGKVKEFVKIGNELVYDFKVENGDNYIANGFIAYGMFE